MNIDEHVRQRIEGLIASDKVVLFMKGTPQMPQCGFSAATVSILDDLVPNYTTVNVLEDSVIREGIKAYSSWPTVPQLYIDKEFVGGCDIVKQMFSVGALHEVLGLEAPDRSAPAITLSDGTAEMFRSALGEQPGMAVHLRIDGHWQHEFILGRAEGHEVKTTTNGVEILMDVATAQRAQGLVVDVEDTFQGRSLRINNPQAPGE